ncbi:hypothetical protein [Segnochrobactrum spirostomi]|uniref:Uncharacterized protein n=1 Tax=Segnochrobactrum spirostomi TaxID=2608987 RepID=A0A6A7Y0S6_9HYPH|nr:hypothetical protein [Segnochrobactrum spirostomi]MQT12680.1 hypothetical protein [Segnochrobactrum spirostomi]
MIVNTNGALKLDDTTLRAVAGGLSLDIDPSDIWSSGWSSLRDDLSGAGDMSVSDVGAAAVGEGGLMAGGAGAAAADVGAAAAATAGATVLAPIAAGVAVVAAVAGLAYAAYKIF